MTKKEDVFMKVGIRKPSIKKSLSSRTTGRVNRSLKRSVNPMYRKKNINYITNPSRAIKNNLYHKTTVSAKDILDAGTNDHVAPGTNNINTSTSSKTGFLDFIVALCNLIYSFVMAMFYLVITLGLLAIIVGLFYIAFKLIF